MQAHEDCPFHRSVSLGDGIWTGNGGESKKSQSHITHLRPIPVRPLGHSEPLPFRQHSAPQHDRLLPAFSLFIAPRCTSSLIPRFFTTRLGSFAGCWRSTFISTRRKILMTSCPQCGSSRIEARDLGKKAGSTIGAVAGAASGAAAILSGAEAGATVGVLAGPAGALLGGVAGALLGGFFGGAAGCAAGAAVGEALDESILGNRQCLDCHHTFAVPVPAQ